MQVSAADDLAALVEAAQYHFPTLEKPAVGEGDIAILLDGAVRVAWAWLARGGSLLVQRAQARGMDPGTATSIAALYPALMMILSVDAGFEKLSVLKVCGLLLAAGSGVCFAKDLAR